MQVKGSAAAVLPIFIKAKFGEASVEPWLKSLDPAAQEAFRRSIFVSNWYDYQEILLKPTITLCDLFYKGSDQGAYDVGLFSAEYSLKGIYKLFLQFGSPEFILKRGTSILPTYYNPCKIEMTVTARDHCVVRITEFPEIHKMIERRIAGWIVRALELSGARNMKLDITASLLTGQPFTEFKGSWN